MTDEPSISSSDVSVKRVEGFDPGDPEDRASSRSAVRAEVMLVFDELKSLDDPEAEAAAQELREATHPGQHSLAWEAERRFDLGVLR